MDDVIALSFDRSALSDDGFFLRRLVDLPVFAPPPLRDDVRRLAQRAWLDRARSEYVGVMIGRRFWGLLVDINAPVDIQELALNMVLDEQRHAHLCIAAAVSLGAGPEVDFDLSELQQERTEEPIHDQVMQMIVQTYSIGEVTALGLIRFALRDLPESGYRDVLKRVATDEVLHARIGPALLREVRSGHTASWLPWPGDEQVRQWARSYIGAMAERDVVESDELLLFGDAAAARELRQVGIPHSGDFRVAYHQALGTDVVDGFQSMDGLWPSQEA